MNIWIKRINSNKNVTLDVYLKCATSLDCIFPISSRNSQMNKSRAVMGHHVLELIGCNSEKMLEAGCERVVGLIEVDKELAKNAIMKDSDGAIVVLFRVDVS